MNLSVTMTIQHIKQNTLQPEYRLSAGRLTGSRELLCTLIHIRWHQIWPTKSSPWDRAIHIVQSLMNKTANCSLGPYAMETARLEAGCEWQDRYSTAAHKCYICVTEHKSTNIHSCCCHSSDFANLPNTQKYAYITVSINFSTVVSCFKKIHREINTGLCWRQSGHERFDF